MANRSHLYTCDALPGAPNFYARGLSECNWDVPLAHTAMMGNQPRIVRSAIWPDHEIAIVAEREGAFERTLALFEKVGARVVDDRAEFDRELDEMRRFLSDVPPARYVLLEAGEILDLLGGDLASQAQSLLGDIGLVRHQLERALSGDADAWISALAGDWKKRAAPGWWSKVLYYSFPEPA